MARLAGMVAPAQIGAPIPGDCAKPATRMPGASASSWRVQRRRAALENANATEIGRALRRT